MLSYPESNFDSKIFPQEDIDSEWEDEGNDAKKLGPKHNISV